MIELTTEEIKAKQFQGGYFRESNRHKWRFASKYFRHNDSVIIIEMMSCRQHVFDKNDVIQTKKKKH